MRVILAVLLISAIAAIPVVSHASDEDEEQGLRTLAVQNRQHTMTHEFSAWIGTLPLDAFTKGLAFTGAYTLHFNDLFAWEIGQFTYSYGIDTDLKADLGNLPQPAGPTPFETVRYFVTSSVLFKPVYGKMALLNRALIYGEVFFLLGGGYGWLTISNRTVLDVGAGGRIYVGKYVSFRVDVRDYMFVTEDDVHNELWIALGICLSFG
ncbi:MAG: outer membrane beta-barrel domain-containing protein [Deltaproteobacteria bacterium]|nr:outer membrane beta-barrel domain-containing protein [Deltaproteobacteria bacterium]